MRDVAPRPVTIGADTQRPGDMPAPGVGPHTATPTSSVDLYWIPLGAGGARVVRLSGRIYEAIRARAEHRTPLDLYHTALEVRVPDGCFTIENAWPSPDADTAGRGVMLEGPVASRRLARLRVFRYEVRCWRDGIIPDIGEAVGSPQLLSDDPVLAQNLLGLVSSVPTIIWGRDELGTGDMWNSNSVISFLLTRSGLPVHRFRPPAGGRAPGWEAGMTVARRHLGRNTHIDHPPASLAAAPGPNANVGSAELDRPRTGQ